MDRADLIRLANTEPNLKLRKQYQGMLAQADKADETLLAKAGALPVFDRAAQAVSAAASALRSLVGFLDSKSGDLSPYMEPMLLVEDGMRTLQDALDQYNRKYGPGPTA